MYSSRSCRGYLDRQRARQSTAGLARAPNTDVAVGRKAIRRISYNLRLSPAVIAPAPMARGSRFYRARTLPARWPVTAKADRGLTVYPPGTVTKTRSPRQRATAVLLGSRG